MVRASLSLAFLVAIVAAANAEFSAVGFHPGGPGNPLEANEYQIDDGVAENSIGAGGGHLGWLTRYSVNAGNEVLTGIRVAFGTTTAINGMPVTAYLWSDPNGDGNPADAAVLASAAGVVSGATPGVPISNIFVDFDIPDTFVGNAGTNFFLGAVIANYPTANFPAAIDQTAPLPGVNTTFAVFHATNPINPNTLGTDQNLTDFTTLPANLQGRWLVRGNAVAIPEPTGLALVGFAGLLALIRRLS